MNKFLITSIVQIGLGLLVAKILNTTDLTIYFATAYLISNYNLCMFVQAIKNTETNAELKD